LKNIAFHLTVKVIIETGCIESRAHYKNLTWASAAVCLKFGSPSKSKAAILGMAARK
jgi:hypothetical protein